MHAVELFISSRLDLRLFCHKNHSITVSIESPPSLFLPCHALVALVAPSSVWLRQVERTTTCSTGFRSCATSWLEDSRATRPSSHCGGAVDSSLPFDRSALRDDDRRLRLSSYHHRYIASAKSASAFPTDCAITGPVVSAQSPLSSRAHVWQLCCCRRSSPHKHY